MVLHVTALSFSCRHHLNGSQHTAHRQHCSWLSCHLCPQHAGYTSTCRHGSSTLNPSLSFSLLSLSLKPPYPASSVCSIGSVDRDSHQLFVVIMLKSNKELIQSYPLSSCLQFWFVGIWTRIMFWHLPGKAKIGMRVRFLTSHHGCLETQYTCRTEEGK